MRRHSPILYPFLLLPVLLFWDCAQTTPPILGDDAGQDATADGRSDASDSMELPDDLGSDVRTDAVDMPPDCEGEDCFQRAVGEICTADEQCQSFLCLFFEAGAVEGICTTYCATDEHCPDETYDCVYVFNSGVDLMQLCVPADLCIDHDEDGYGTGPGCLGRDCDDGEGMVNPGQYELCDGLDNNCDGAEDNTPVDVGERCNTELEGQCALGITICDGNRGQLVCIPEMYSSVEVCNNLDDDCDGDIDEDPEGEPLSEECYYGPEGTEGIGQCHSGTRTCAAGHFGACLGQGLPYPEVCNNLDDNCNGPVDEGNPGSDIRCDTGEDGVCAAGVTSCEDGTLHCNRMVDPDDDVCDGLDNNCDGTVDEDFLHDGLYDTNTACGNCYTDCTVIYDKPSAFGSCSSSPDPTCVMNCDVDHFNLNDVPDDGCEFLLDAQAIYVSIQGLDNSTCGLGPDKTVPAANQPCRTINHGLSRASSLGRRRVLVADGEYEENVNLLAGIDLLGGFRADTWERHLSSTGTIIRAPQGSGHRKAVSATGITTSTVFEGFVVYAAYAITLGSNSYGVYIRDSNGNLVVRNNKIYAGMGAPGVEGADGTSGLDGVDGGDGANTFNTICSPGYSYTTRAGAAGVRSCQDPATFPPGGGDDTFTVTSGGTGGAPICPDRYYQSGSGSGGSNGGGSGGSGGYCHDAETDGSCWPTPDQMEVGQEGNVGAPATDGTGGPGCSSSLFRGSIVGNEWVGYSGSNGTHGTHGRGGGGGGSGGGQQLIDYWTYDVSGGGGGGGSGGCAGQRGTYSQAGGGSFGIFLYFTTDPTSSSQIPQVYGNTVVRNYGGDAGDGGNGGAGGDGGIGGNGGDVTIYSGPIYCIFGGANGGLGSRGGHGGGGGGGCGGISYDIALFNYNSVAYSSQIHDNVFPITGAENTGGIGGNGGNSSNTTIGLGGNGYYGAYGNLGLVP